MGSQSCALRTALSQAPRIRKSWPSDPVPRRKPKTASQERKREAAAPCRKFWSVSGSAFASKSSSAGRTSSSRLTVAGRLEFSEAAAAQVPSQSSAQARASASCFQTRLCPWACPVRSDSRQSLAIARDSTSGNQLAKARESRASVWAQKACSSSPSQLCSGPIWSFSMQMCHAVSPVFLSTDFKTNLKQQRAQSKNWREQNGLCCDSQLSEAIETAKKNSKTRHSPRF